MAMHNFKQPHVQYRPCRMKCGVEVEALNRKTGQIEAHPICKECRAELDRQFRVASIQRAKAQRPVAKPAVR